MPARFATKEPREGSDRGFHFAGPDLDRDAAIHLPRDPRDVRRVEDPYRLLASPFARKVGEEVLPAEDCRVDRHPVPLQDPSLLQAEEPLANRRRGQRDPAAERLQALSRVFIERYEQSEILLVHGPAKECRR